MPFGQLIIGPPGAGKTTYCNGMHQFLNAIGRKSSVINLDPANDSPSYPCALDVRDLVTLEDVMAEERLGPNGGVLYALEEVEGNEGWLEDGLRRLMQEGKGMGEEEYFLFDCPGQVELFTHHGALRKVFLSLQKEGFRLVVIHLIDSYVLSLPSLYISALLLSLRTMLQMDLPQINVLTKIDNLSKYPELPFNLDFYTEVQDLNYLLPHLSSESPMFGPDGKFAGLNQAIVDLVEEFGLVGFEVLAVEDKKSMMSLLQTIDKAGGYAFGGPAGANDTVWQVAVREGLGKMDVRDVQDRWLDNKEEWDERERKQREEEAKTREGSGGDDSDDELGDLNIPLNSGIKVVRETKNP